MKDVKFNTKRIVSVRIDSDGRRQGVMKEEREGEVEGMQD